MTDHTRWRTLAATAMDFELDARERDELDDHLRDCVACRRDAAGLRNDAQLLRGLDFGLAPAAIRSRLVAASGLEIATGPSAVLLFIGAILLILATFGAAIGVGSLVDDDPTTLLSANGSAVSWQTQVAQLTATEFWIDVDGTRFTAPGNVVVHSDPAGTLEMTWHEGGVEMRLYLYFDSDATGWSVREIRTSDGRARGGWVYYDSLSYHAATGDPIVGDFLVPMAKADNPAVRRAILRLGGLRLAISRDLAVGPEVNLPGGAIDVPVPLPNALAVDPSIRPVSLSNPGDATGAIESCHVREFADQVIGMGRLSHASDVTLYARMSSTDVRPAWVVTFRGTITFGDARLEDATCVVFDDGSTLVPLAPDRTIEPLLRLPPLDP